MLVRDKIGMIFTGDKTIYASHIAEEIQNLVEKFICKDFVKFCNAGLSLIYNSPFPRQQSLWLSPIRISAAFAIQFTWTHFISLCKLNNWLFNSISFSSLLKSLPLNLRSVCSRGSKAPRVGKIRALETLNVYW